MKVVLSFQLVCVLMLTSLNSILGWRPYHIEYLNFTIYSLNENVEANGTVNENGLIEFYVNLKEIVAQPFVRIEFYVDFGNGLFDLKVLNETVDVCRFFRDKRYLTFMQIVHKSIVQQINTRTSSCPIRKQLFVAKNVQMDVEKLPPTLPNKKFYLALTWMSKRGAKLIPMLVSKTITAIKNS